MAGSIWAMRTRMLRAVAALTFLSFGAAAFGQSTQPGNATPTAPTASAAVAPSAASAARLSAAEKLLAEGTAVTPDQLKNIASLAAEIEASPADAQLRPRAELVLSLAQQHEISKESTAAWNAGIRRDVEAVQNQQRWKTQADIASYSFWTGLSALGLAAASATLADWATTQGTPYVEVGRIAPIVSLVGVAVGIAGVGTAWFLAVNPFDTPPTPTYTPITPFPRANMSTDDKIFYLNNLKTEKEILTPRAEKIRTASNISLAAGLVGTVAALVSGNLGDQANHEYNEAYHTGDAAALHKTVTTYQYVLIGAASLAVVGLTGALLGYLLGPDPVALSSSIATLNSQLRDLEIAQNR